MFQELSDLRHAYSKQKKALNESNSELEHMRSRAEQYESEVRKVRGRVDELKHALAVAEDEVRVQAKMDLVFPNTPEIFSCLHLLFIFIGGSADSPSSQTSKEQ